MTTAPMKNPTLRASAAFAAAGIMLGMLVGCSPADPEPTPTKTELFASEEEAFAAAEETYRAYTDALNEVDTAEPTTFEPVYAFTTGDFASRDRKNLTTMHAEDYVMTGDSVVRSFAGTSFDSHKDEVIGTVCIDVSKTDIVNAEGESMVAVDRPDVYGAIVTFTVDDGHLLISRADGAEDEACDVS